MNSINPKISFGVLGLLLLLQAQAVVASELLTEDELRRVAENIVAVDQYGQQVNYLQRYAEQDKEDRLIKYQPGVSSERRSALLNGKITPAIVAEENYRDWLLSGAMTLD